MKCIDELQKIGIDTISAKTRITQDKLQNIIDYKYDAFDKTRARGFVQIIEREFGVDLSEWFAAYNDYHSAPAEQINEANEGGDEIARQINIPIESDKKDKSYAVLIVLLIVLVVLFMSFFIYNNVISPNTNKSAPQSTLTPLQEIQQNKNDLAREEAQNVVDLSVNATDSANLSENSLDSNVNPNQNAQDSNANPSVENPANLSTNTANLSANLSANPSANLSENPNANQITANQTAPTNSTIAQSTIATQTEELIITPNEPLWVGIIDLKTRRKKQLSIDARHAITMDGDKIIRTGHSYFSVSSGTNFAKQYIGGDNKYFLYKMDGGLKEISKAEFLELNKGEEW